MNINLDKIDIAKADPRNMRDFLGSFADLCREAWATGESFALPAYFIKCRKIVILGMGASGIAGEFLADLLYDSKMVVTAIHDYNLPGWVDKDTMVISLCHSGNTEEVLYAFVSAYEKNAKLLAITTGGRLESLCGKYRAPIIKYRADCEPKLALPYLLLIPFVLLTKLGVLEFNHKDFDKSLLSVSAQIGKITNNIGLATNPAKDLAMKIFNQNIQIISAANLRAAAIRFSNSINENGKNLSAYHFLPEADHNLVAGLQNPKKLIAETTFIFFESKFARPEIKKRFNVTAKILNGNNVSYIRVDFPQAGNKLSEILLSTIFGDFVGMYLGFLNQVDPSSARVVEQIKGELAK